MKLKFGFTFFCCLLSLGVYAQSASDYLNKAKARLNEGNCESAQRCYNVYKNLSGETDASVEAQIRMCNSKIVVTETSDRRTVPYVPLGYVDLGLPSGTLWKSKNEDNFYNHKDAFRLYGDNLPSEAQWQELNDKCSWTYISPETGFRVLGPNGNSIILPLSGFQRHFYYKSEYGTMEGTARGESTDGEGYYWSFYWCNSGQKCPCETYFRKGEYSKTCMPFDEELEYSVRLVVKP